MLTSDTSHFPYHIPTGYQLIAKEDDEWGTILILKRGNSRIMTFDSIFEQSKMDTIQPLALTHKYTQTMFLITAFTQPAHVTLLGLGGGCLLRSLHFALPNSRFHVVELRPKVYQLAQEYFELPEDHRVQFSIQDAEIALQTMGKGETDLIMADMFFAHGANPLQTTDHFLVSCNKALSDEGWLVINFHQQTELASSFFKSVKCLFQSVLVGTSTNGNYILFASKLGIDNLPDYRSNILQWQETIDPNLSQLFDRLIRFS